MLGNSDEEMEVEDDELVGERQSEQENSSEEEEEEGEEEKVPEPEPVFPMALPYSRQKFKVFPSTDGPGIARNYNRPIRIPDGTTLGLMKDKDSGVSAWPTGDSLHDSVTPGTSHSNSQPF